MNLFPYEAHLESRYRRALSSSHVSRSAVVGTTVPLMLNMLLHLQEYLRLVFLALESIYRLRDD